MGNVRILVAKPHRLLPPVLDEVQKLHAEGKPVLFVVPEQMTVSAEELIMERLCLRCLIGVDVLSPTKLYDNLLHHLGKDETRPLSDMGYRMAIGQTLENMDDKLRYFRKSNRFAGMVDRLAALITDMKRGGLTAELLQTLSETAGNDILKAKFADLALILNRYTLLIEGRFHDSEDRMGYVASRMTDCAYLQDKTVFLYGFDTVTEQLSGLICALAPHCRETDLAMVCNIGADGDHALYTPVTESIARLREKLGQKQIPVKIEKSVQSDPQLPPDLVHLDENMMVTSCKPYTGEIGSISIHSSLRPFEEATLMSRQLLSCLRSGIPLSRITVMTPDSASYDFAVSAALSDAGIPFFDNRPMRALTHPLVQFLLASLRAMESHWSKDNMQPLLYSPYIRLGYEEACRLRGYVQAYGIARNRWEEPFTRGSDAERSECEALRLELMEPLLNCRRALLDAKTAKESIRAVFTYLEECECYAKLKAENDKLIEMGLSVRAEQSNQIWAALVEMFDDAVRLEGEDRLPLKHIANRFESGLSAVSLATLPPAGEILQTGILGHMIAEEADVVFLMGLNEGILTKQTDSLLKEEERAFAVSESHCYLGLTDISRNLMARLDLKNAMTLPKKHLYLSYAETAPNGEGIEPLAELGYLNNAAFGGKIPINPPTEDLPLSPRQAERMLSHMSGTDAALQSPEWQAILGALENSPDRRKLWNVLNYSGIPQQLSREECLALFGTNMSVSTLESYAECQFKHFIQSGLRPCEPKCWEIDSAMRGNYSHDAINRFSKLAIEDKQYPSVSDKVLEEMTASALRLAEENLQSDLIHDTPRNEAQLQKLQDVVRRSIRSLTAQLKDGSFRMVETEAKFGKGEALPPMKITLEDGLPLTLRGTIDRIDCCEVEGESFQRVIDYKSSKHDLKAGQIQLGAQLQLLLYLNICSQLHPGSVPAATLYFHMQDPYAEMDGNDSAAAEEEIQKAFKMSGIMIEEAVPLTGGTEKGPLHASATTMSREAMRRLLKLTGDVAKDMAQRMYDGQIAINPADFGNNNSCSFCPGKEICKREEHSISGEPRYPEKTKLSDWIAKIQQEIDSENEEKDEIALN